MIFSVIYSSATNQGGAKLSHASISASGGKRYCMCPLLHTQALRHPWLSLWLTGQRITGHYVQQTSLIISVNVQRNLIFFSSFCSFLSDEQHSMLLFQLQNLPKRWYRTSAVSWDFLDFLSRCEAQRSVLKVLDSRCCMSHNSVLLVEFF